MDGSEDSREGRNPDLIDLSPMGKTTILVLYCAVLCFTAIAGVYVITYFLFIGLFLVIASTLGGHGGLSC